MSSDHFPIITSILHRKPSKDNLPLSTKWKIKSAHWEEFKEETKNISLSNNPLMERVEIITAKLLEAAEKHIPKTKQKTNQSMNIWWNRETATARTERQRARRQWKRNNTIENRIKYNLSLIHI